MSLKCIILVTLASTLMNVSNGADDVPDAVVGPMCMTLIPPMGTQTSQTTLLPYELKIEPNSLLLGVGSIKLTLKTKNPNDYFTGVLIQARNSRGEDIGTFENPSDNVRVIGCSEGTNNNAVIQVDGLKKTEMTVTWKSSPGNGQQLVQLVQLLVQSLLQLQLSPKIYFVYTVVKDFYDGNPAHRKDNIFWDKQVTATS